MSCTRTTFTANVAGDNLPELQMWASNAVCEFFDYGKDYELEVQEAPTVAGFKYIGTVYVSA